MFLFFHSQEEKDVVLALRHNFDAAAHFHPLTLYSTVVDALKDAPVLPNVVVQGLSGTRAELSYDDWGGEDFTERGYEVMAKHEFPEVQLREGVNANIGIVFLQDEKDFDTAFKVFVDAELNGAQQDAIRQEVEARIKSAENNLAYSQRLLRLLDGGA